MASPPNQAHAYPPLLHSSGPSVLDTNPHLANYIFKLVLSSHALSAASRAPSGQHPLSVSSSGESDEDDDTHSPSSNTPSASDNNTDSGLSSADDESGRSVSSSGKQAPAPAGPSREEREELVRKVITLLDNEQEEDVKDLLRQPMGELAKDDGLMDQIALDCMHRHRDDQSGVPYQTGAFTPTRVRPTRPYTPTGVGTLRVRTPLARPHSPAIPSGAQTPTSTGGGHLSALSRVDSASSATFAPGAPGQLPSSGYASPAGSPLSNAPRLNIKAATFNPNNATSSSSPRATMPSITVPSDPWRDADLPVRTGSPFKFGGQIMSRTGSNRAIAAPLISDPSSPFHSPLGTPTRPHMKLANDIMSPSTSRPASRGGMRGVVPDDDDDDEFSPFGSTKSPSSHNSTHLNLSAKPFEPSGSSDLSSGGLSDHSASYDSRASDTEQDTQNPTGMTPLDVLSSVFSTVPRHELEDALHRSGYDFEAAMAMLVSKYTLPRSGASTPSRASPRPMIGLDGRGTSTHAPGAGYFQQGGRGFPSGPGLNPGFGGVRNISNTSNSNGPTRMCRYFLNGECRRSDCRFSHDLERALCRFWLRGHCAKGPNCEFLHNLPNNMDPSALNHAMQRLDVNSPGRSHPGTPPYSEQYGAGDDFPDLLAARLNRVGRFDPARNRFANAVKRPTPAPPQPMIHLGTGAGRFSPAPQQQPQSPAPEPRAPVTIAPRASQRIKLRPPTLLPTLQTGTAANDQYLSARQTAIRLGHARNACLARAADAFRRGDGAAAKRFSREGKALNEKMVHEAAEAAQALVKERMRDAQDQIRKRSPSWSDDVRDRAERGRECGGGLGVVMGVASASKVPDGARLSADERTECLLDLHTLHGPEGSDITSAFLADLEREHFRGLAYIVVGEEKHVGTQDPLRGASRVRLANSVKTLLCEWSYPWSEKDGVLCVDAFRG